MKKKEVPRCLAAKNKVASGDGRRARARENDDDAVRTPEMKREASIARKQ